MPSVTVSVVTELLGHDHGHWCPRCLLSSGIRAWLAVRVGPRLTMHVRTWCQECGNRSIDVDPDGRHC
jgi:hypothetical protein